MTPSAALLSLWRIATATAAAGGRLALYADASLLAEITLASPAGTADETGIALADTDYAQLAASGPPTHARLYSSSGALLGIIPAAELVLPAEYPTLYAGAFVKLSGARINQ